MRSRDRKRFVFYSLNFDVGQLELVGLVGVISLNCCFLAHVPQFYLQRPSPIRTLDARVLAFRSSVARSGGIDGHLLAIF